MISMLLMKNYMGADIIFSLKFPLAFFCRLLYHNREHNWINCLRGGVKFPTGGIVRERA